MAIMSTAAEEDRLFNLDQFCPLCYNEDKVMRNVFKEKTDTTKNPPLYCERHGLVLYEDAGLLRYRTSGVVPSLDETEPIVGKGKVGLMKIA